MEDPFTLESTLENDAEWKLELIDSSFAGQDGVPELYLETELTIGSRWGDHYTFCFDGENKKYETDPARAIRDFSAFIEACVTMRDKMIDSAVAFDKE